MILASACWVKDVYVDYVLRSLNILHDGYKCMYVCLRFLVCSIFRHVGWNIRCLIKLQRQLIVHFWLVKLQFILILQSCHFCHFRSPQNSSGADSRKGVRTGRTLPPPPLKVSKIIGYSRVYNVFDRVTKVLYPYILYTIRTKIHPFPLLYCTQQMSICMDTRGYQTVRRLSL